MENNNAILLHEVASYYSKKLTEHGQTPAGVDWNGEESQCLRFKQLCKIINTQEPFSINDLGCGYGAFYDFLAAAYKNFSYCGIDIAEKMIQAAKQRFQDNPQIHFLLANRPSQIADYTVASGIFNVFLNQTHEQWQSYIESTLDVLHKTSRLGFSFNCLTSYSDQEKMKDNLYYADPCFLFDWCKRRYSRNVALLHDYDLYEFTILVKKS